MHAKIALDFLRDWELLRDSDDTLFPNCQARPTCSAPLCHRRVINFEKYAPTAIRRARNFCQLCLTPFCFARENSPASPSVGDQPFYLLVFRDTHRFNELKQLFMAKLNFEKKRANSQQCPVRSFFCPFTINLTGD